MFDKYVRNLLMWAMILVFVLYLVLPLIHQRPVQEEVSYSEFLWIPIDEDAGTGYSGEDTRQ